MNFFFFFSIVSKMKERLTTASLRNFLKSSLWQVSSLSSSLMRYLWSCLRFFSTWSTSVSMPALGASGSEGRIMVLKVAASWPSSQTIWPCVRSTVEVGPSYREAEGVVGLTLKRLERDAKLKETSTVETILNWRSLPSSVTRASGMSMEVKDIPAKENKRTQKEEEEESENQECNTISTHLVKTQSEGCKEGPERREEGGGRREEEGCQEGLGRMALSGGILYLSSSVTTFSHSRTGHK